MPIIAKDNRKEYTPAPEGLHQAVCVDVVDKGLQETPFGPKHQVQLRWQLGTIDEASGAPVLMLNDAGQPFMIIQTYTNSLNEKARLRQQLESWRGRNFTKEELEGFDLEKLIGVNCQIQVVHNILADGRTYANIQAIVPLGKKMVKLAADPEYVRECNRSKGNSTPADPENNDDIPF